jgi:2-phospho-L-lactate guanylyltransferase (CobY/MobA/RfbA family)
MHWLIAANDNDILAIAAVVGAVIVLFILLVIVAVFANYFRLWIQSFLTGAGITIWDLIGMTFRKVNKDVIVKSKIMAVQAGLEGVGLGGILVINADVPCVVPHDLRSLLAATLAGCLALVEALDGTTNALSLPSADAFAPLYGPSSSDRFRAHGTSLGLEVVSVSVPNLADDVDTMEDLTRLQLRAGPRTQACLLELERSVV